MADRPTTSESEQMIALGGGCDRTGLSRAEILFTVAAAISILGLLLALLLPSAGRGREPARRAMCKHHLREIGLALRGYHDFNGVFPPVHTVDADGKPLHSWRTLILPYIEHAPRYNSLDLSKPWGDPTNIAEFQKPAPFYSCPSSIVAAEKTTYLAVVNTDSVLQPNKSRALSDISDGAANTILVIEVPYQHAVSWMLPQDAVTAQVLRHFQGDLKEWQHFGGTHALFADGTVKFISLKIEPAKLKALFTANGGEQ